LHWKPIAYDYENRVTQITYPNSATNTFNYNALDTRVGKVDSTGTYTYKRDGAGVTNDVLSDGSSAYTPGISVRNSRASTEPWSSKATRAQLLSSPAPTRTVSPSSSRSAKLQTDGPPSSTSTEILNRIEADRC